MPEPEEEVIVLTNSTANVTLAGEVSELTSDDLETARTISDAATVLTELRTKVVSDRRIQILEKTDEQIAVIVETPINRALNIKFANDQLSQLTQQIAVVIGDPNIVKPLQNLCNEYMNSSTRYQSVLQKVQLMYEMHGRDLMLAAKEGPEAVKSAMLAYSRSLETLPDLTESEEKLRAAIIELNEAIFQAAGDAHCDLDEKIDIAEAQLAKRREEFTKAEKQYKTNQKMLEVLKEGDNEQLIKFLDSRIAGIQKEITDCAEKLKKAVSEEKSTKSSKVSKKKIWFVTFDDNYDERIVVDTAETQRMCKDRIKELGEQLDKLVEDKKKVSEEKVDKTVLHQGTAETFQYFYDSTKEQLQNAQETYKKLMERRQAMLLRGRMSKSETVFVNRILHNLRIFAMYALPCLKHYGNLKEIVGHIIGENGISATRLLATMKPLADGFIEDEVLSITTGSRCRQPQLINYYRAIGDIEDKMTKKNIERLIEDPTISDNRLPDRPSVHDLEGSSYSYDF